MFSHRRKSSQESRSDRDGMRLAHRAVQGENEALSRLSESDSDTRLILEEQGDQLPSEAKSEVLKQRCRADLLDCSICELQRQIHSSRIGDWSYQSRIWNITKRTSLAEKEHIEKRMLVVLVKWKTWKELRNCELTNSPDKTWQEVMLLYTSSHHKYRSYKRRRIAWTILESFKMYNRFALENYHTFPVNLQSLQVLVGCRPATKACDLRRGTCLVHRGTFLTIHLHQSTQHRHLKRGMLHPWNPTATFGGPSAAERGEACSLKWRTKTETRNQSRDLQGDRQPGILSVQPNQYIHGIFWLINKDFRSRSFILQCLHTVNFFMLEDMIQNPSKCLFQFTLGDNVMDQRSGDGRFSGRSKSSHSIQEFFHFPNFEMLDARIASNLNKIIQIPTSRKGQSGGTESSKRGSVPSRKTDRFMIYDLRVTGAYDTVLDYADLFAITLRNDDVQGIQYEMAKFNYR